MAESLDALCPERGPGLKHTQDSGVDLTGKCVHCHTQLEFRASAGPSVDQVIFEIRQNLPADPPLADPVLDAAIAIRDADTLKEPGYDRTQGPQGNKDGRGRGALTVRQTRDLAFLAWLRGEGRAD